MYIVKVENLPRWISEIHLKQAFHSCGKIISATVALDQDTLRTLGHGYITFADEAAVRRALDKDNTILDGETIVVSFVEEVAAV